jgi:hypothetical protein
VDQAGGVFLLAAVMGARYEVHFNGVVELPGQGPLKLLLIYYERKSRVKDFVWCFESIRWLLQSKARLLKPKRSC